ncbi:MAG: pSRTUE45c [Actinomycetia bacterium]|nr:pSRTUE45c [Actinomycetes bacterium]
MPTSERLLTRRDALDLLLAGGRGRVAATRRAVPIIIPVTFGVVDDDVVFSPEAGEGRDQAITDAVVAFETDKLGADGHTEWEVHVTGVARVLDDATGLHRFRLSSPVVTGWRSRS